MSIGIQTSKIRRASGHGPTLVDGMPMIPASGVGHIVKAGASIANAMSKAVAGDVLFLEEGAYNEQVTIAKRLIFVGLGGRGAAFVQPTASNPVAITVTANDVTLINVGAEASGTGTGLLVSGSVRRFRAYNCKFEGGTNATRMISTAAGAPGDSRFEDCEFAWATNGLHLTLSGGGDPVTQTYVRHCLFHNITADCILTSVDKTSDLWVVESVFSAQEDGTEATQYLDIDEAGTTGFVVGNYFATSLWSTAKFAIATGVLVAGNYTQAESGGGNASGTSGRPDA